MTRGEFMHHVFADPRIGVEKTLHTRRAWQAENQAEGGEADWNPTNTTLVMPNSRDYNRVGVQEYASAAEGLEATILTLTEPRYTSLLHALRQNYPATEICEIWGASPWGTALTLMMQIRAEFARFPLYLRTLEKKEIAS